MFSQDKVCQELAKTKNRISQLQDLLANFPEGHILVLRNGKHIRYAHVCNGERKHISKKDDTLIMQLSHKAYLTAQLSDFKQKEKALLAFLKSYGNYQSKTDEFLSHPLKHELVKNFCRPLSEELFEWASAPFDSNTSHPDQLRHSCISGNKVRSKSEVFIDQILFLHGIPYRYECLLKLGDISLYPDFTIRHPKTGKIFYWEHFGLMDDPHYAQNVFHKMELYNKHGILPSEQLITTFENQDHPLTMDTVEEIVHRYFC